MINGERSRKIIRDRKYKMKLKKLYEIWPLYCVCFYEPTDEWRTGITVNKPHYRKKGWKKHSGRKNIKRYYKNMSNRLVRRSAYDDVPLKGNGYRKEYDLWMKLY